MSRGRVLSIVESLDERAIARLSLELGLRGTRPLALACWHPH